MPASGSKLRSRRLLNGVVDCADQRLIGVLQDQQWSDVDVGRVVSFWSSKARPGETLATFLQRNEILAPGATTVLQLKYGEQLLDGDTQNLFKTDGLAKLRQLLIRPLCVPKPSDNVKSGLVAAVSSVKGNQKSSAHQNTPVMRKVAAKASEQTPIPQKPATCELPGGHILGRCLITGRIASGSYGVVYRALHRSLNIPV